MVDYGTDLSCTDDLTPNMGEVSGLLCLAQAIVRRWTTPRGAVIDDPNYGFDLQDYLDSDVGPNDINPIQSSLVAEALKDQRVLVADVQVTIVATVLIVNASITGAEGPFTLVLSISNVTVSILQVTPS